MTDEERCEVAAELRELAEDYEKVPAWDVIAAGELPAPVDDVFMACGLGRAVHATEICGRLADLIEPEERTCYVEHIDDDSFHLSCGHEAAGHVSPSFCPYCGAKVVEQ